MEGNAVDLRHQPLIGVRFSGPFLNQPVTGPDGRTSIYLADKYLYTVSFNRGGLLAPEPQVWDMNTYDPADSVAVMRGPEERITNGQFKTAGQSGWQPTGPWASADAYGRLGGLGAAAGMPCSDTLCLTTAEAAGGAVMMVIDSLGQAHTLSQDGVYQVRGVDGVWQAGPALPPGSYQSLTLGADDELLVIQTAPEAKLFRKPAGGQWSDLALPAPVSSASMAVDGQGMVHMVYQAKIDGALGGTYVTRLDGAAWQPPGLLISDSRNETYPQIAVEPGGTEHMLMKMDYSTLRHISIRPGGVIESDQNLPKYAHSLEAAPRLVLDSQGNLHALARMGYIEWDDLQGEVRVDNYLYWSRPNGKIWSYAEVLFNPSELTKSTSMPALPMFGTMVVDDEDTLHLVVTDVVSPTRSSVVYLAKPAGANQFHKINATLPFNLSSLAAAFDKDGRAHLLAGASDSGPGTSVYHQAAFPAQPVQSGLQQTITLPVSMHKPTLSLFYRIYQIVPDDESGLEVVVHQPGKEPALVLAKMGGAPEWTHAWADLTPWLGQEITLELRLAQAAGKYPSRLYLDEVTVGSWTTPVVHAVIPNVIDSFPAEGMQVRIQGENLEGTQVFLNGTAVKRTEIDPATGDLLITIEPSIKLGYQNLRILASSGIDSVYPGALRIGRLVHLPVIAQGW